MTKKDSDKQSENQDARSLTLPPVKTAARWYETYASSIATDYERFSFREVHQALLKHLPKNPGTALDIGAGSGRDAAGLADLGYSVTAVEPCRELRAIAQRKHRSPNIDWIDDSLPKLMRTRRTGLNYSLVLLSAVWMHVARSERSKAFRRIVSMLSPGGLLCITLRHGPHEKLQGFWDVPDADVRELARDHGLFEIESVSEEDRLGRAGVHWTRMIFQMPGDGTGALPLLRGIILNDNKSSTYKLGLLRVLIRISQSAGGMAKVHGDDKVVIPLGLFALYWLRLYRPLLDENLPQNPGNTEGTVQIGFAKEAYASLARVSPLDFRMGMSFPPEIFKQLHRTLSLVCHTLVKMPMRYTTYPGSQDAVFVASPQPRPKLHRFTIDAEYLRSFGSVTIPLDVWQTAQNYGVWLEPTIIAEWKELMKNYATSQGNQMATLERMENALVLSDPTRSTLFSRKRAELLLQNGTFGHCVWSGKQLRENSMDIDHCFPFSAWPCEDLWNLLPSSRDLNQRKKRNKLPSRERLHQARERILDWWDAAYLDVTCNTSDQFFTEAAASLRLLTPAEPELGDVFDSLMLQQTHLRSSQQIPLWNGTTPN